MQSKTVTSFVPSLPVDTKRRVAIGSSILLLILLYHYPRGVCVGEKGPSKQA